MQPAEYDPATGQLVFEYNRFACTHTDLGVVLAEHWNLPEKIKQGIAYHHHPAFCQAEEIPAAVRAEVLAVFLAGLLAIHLGLDESKHTIVMPHASFEALLPDSTLQDILADKRIAMELQRIGEMQF